MSKNKKKTKNVVKSVAFNQRYSVLEKLTQLKKEKAKINAAEKQKRVENQLIKDSYLIDEILFKKYKSRYEGLTSVEAQEKIEEFGLNVIESKDKNPLLHQIKEAVINPFNVVLIIVALITFITDVVIATEKDYATFILITSTIIISTIISLNQSMKSDKAAKELKNMISNKIDVYRDGQIKQINVSDVALGDIVKLSSGDMIPADVKFLETKDLFIDQAALTGESAPVEKYANWKKAGTITDLQNIGLMGTDVVSGSARAIVINIGEDTYFGNMAKSLDEVNEQNSFEKGVNLISMLLIRMMCIMLPVILAINLFTKADVWDSIIFAITIAVGLTPEMLPVIMTSTLAKGAVVMSKKKTIVKRLSAIQTFGQMDILCTDKTGTLTQDEVILEKYMDCFGNENKESLRLSFLNSYFQTGLKNLIDVAVIKRACKDGIDSIKEEYTRIDEIPFDFVRRRMSVILKDSNDNSILVTKGAVDEIMNNCTYIQTEQGNIALTDELRKQAYQTYQLHNDDGLRVVAVAKKENFDSEKGFSVEDEKEMILVGFIGFLDPPKESAAKAIEALNNHGVRAVVLTGDSEGVAAHVCKKVGINSDVVISGTNIDTYSDDELKDLLDEVNIFAKLSPIQKQRVVRLFQEKGHTVGYMGDGINDSPALKQSDVGISVDTAVDIAKETADIILLEKDLNVLDEGVVNGRKTFTNVLKYIMMATSGNFGNTMSVIIASLFLPFLPLLPIHILMQNLLNDLAQIGMPFDNVDDDYIVSPKKWDTKTIQRFMFIFGPISTLLDVCCFLVLWFIFKYNTVEQSMLFQTGWFAFGIISQTLIIHMIRTHKLPFVQSKPSKQLVISTLSIVLITLILTFTNVSYYLQLMKLPLYYMSWLLILMIGYSLIIEVFKKIYVKATGEWL